MELILWRHAEAEEAVANLPDMKRRLTARGEKQARQMAKWLRSRLPKNTRVLVSPAERTLETAHALDLPFEIEPKIAPDAAPDALIAAAGWPTRNDTVVLVGHQPTLGQLASRLLLGVDGDISVRKGGLWWFSHRLREQESRTILRAVANPDLI